VRWPGQGASDVWINLDAHALIDSGQSALQGDSGRRFYNDVPDVGSDADAFCDRVSRVDVYAGFGDLGE